MQKTLSSHVEINSGVKRVQNMYVEITKSPKHVCRNCETRLTFWNMYVEIVKSAYVQIVKPDSHFGICFKFGHVVAINKYQQSVKNIVVICCLICLETEEYRTTILHMSIQVEQKMDIKLEIQTLISNSQFTNTTA